MTAPAPSAARPTILRMTAPLVVSFWMRSLFTFVDTYFASTLSDAAVAAIGLSLSFEFLMIAIWVGLSTGLTSNLSRAMGARENAKVEQHLRTTWNLVLVAVPAFAVLGGSLWFAAPILAPDAEVARQFAIYGTVLVGGSAFSMFWSVIPDSVVKAHGDTRATMWAGIWSNLVNLGLNIVFTFGFHWGIFGIGFSTVLGRFAGLAYALRKAAAHEARRKAEVEEASPALDPHPYRSVFSLAVPAAVAYALMASEAGIINLLLKGADNAKEAIAAYAIYYRVFQFVVMPAVAAAIAMLPFAARRFGEGDVAGVRQGLREAHVAGLVYAAVAAPLLWLLAAPLAAQLSRSPVTQAYAVFALRLVPLGTLVSLSIFLCRPVFEGLGRGRPGLVMALLRYVVLAAPAAWLGLKLGSAAGIPGLYGLLLGQLVAAALTSAAFLIWVRRVLAELPAAPA